MVYFKKFIKAPAFVFLLFLAGIGAAMGALPINHLRREDPTKEPIVLVERKQQKKNAELVKK